MIIVRMESGGSWYPPIVKAQAILARRAMRENIATYDGLAGQIHTGKRSGENYTPTRQTAKKWEAENPDYPEQAVRQGLVKTADYSLGLGSNYNQQMPEGNDEIKRDRRLSSILTLRY